MTPFPKNVLFTCMYDLSRNLSHKSDPVAEIRLHTTTGNDFTQIVTISNPPYNSPHLGFEQIEITSSYAVKETSGHHTITVDMKNSGSQEATITYVIVDGKPLSQYFRSITSDIPTAGLSIPVGQSKTVTITIASGTFEAGTTLDMKFHSAAGNDYPLMLVLP